MFFLSVFWKLWLGDADRCHGSRGETLDYAECQNLWRFLINIKRRKIAGTLASYYWLQRHRAGKSENHCMVTWEDLLWNYFGVSWILLYGERNPFLFLCWMFWAEFSAVVSNTTSYTWCSWSSRFRGSGFTWKCGLMFSGIRSVIKLHLDEIFKILTLFSRMI